MRKFEYRPPRRSSSLTVDFLLGGRTLHGQCLNVSDAGIRVTLDAELPSDSTGSLTLHHHQRSLTIEAAVTHLHADTDEVGFSFIFHTPKERERTRLFLASTAEQP
jgi:hypothetical protein